MTTTKHIWQRVRFVPPSGEQNAYFGRKCTECGVKVYTFDRFIRWRYPDGTVHDSTTVDETHCTGKVDAK